MTASGVVSKNLVAVEMAASSTGSAGAGPGWSYMSGFGDGETASSGTGQLEKWEMVEGHPLQDADGDIPTILCCMCGVAISANPANMCVNCIRTQIDISEGIPKAITIHWCKNCGRYLQPPSYWLNAALESRELLSYCLKRINGLQHVRLVDASWVWTEPHSRRLKVKVTIQKEVFSNTILQQSFVVEYTVANQQCDKCQDAHAEHTWSGVAQVRQKVAHKRTFLYLEQLILKYEAHRNCISVKEHPNGLDFFFAHRNQLRAFVEFASSVTPCRHKQAKQLVSQDLVSNTCKYKFTTAVEIAPVCKDDVVCLPKSLARQFGQIFPLCIVSRVHSSIRLVDPNTLQIADVNASNYWRCPFEALATRCHLGKYHILDVTHLNKTNGKFVLADVEVAREEDFGVNDNIYTVRTHLGGLLRPGDMALGYAFAHCNFNESDTVGMNGRDWPDHYLVRKYYPIRRSKQRKRKWKLKTLTKEEADGRRNEDKAERDYETFLQDLEEDVEMRSAINLYRREDVTGSESETDEEGFPQIRMNELLDDFNDLSITD